jgi:stress-induced morphogen
MTFLVLKNNTFERRCSTYVDLASHPRLTARQLCVTATRDRARAMVTAEQVRECLRAATVLTPSIVEVTDISGGCGTSFAITVVADAFVSIRLLQRHRMIHAALGGDMEKIHALQLKCYTPQQYAALTETSEPENKSDPPQVTMK